MSFWNGFEKQAVAKKDRKDEHRGVAGSLAGGILGYGAGTLLGRRAYGRHADLFYTPLAGAVAGSRMGGLLKAHHHDYDKKK